MEPCEEEEEEGDLTWSSSLALLRSPPFMAEEEAVKVGEECGEDGGVAAAVATDEAPPLTTGGAL